MFTIARGWTMSDPTYRMEGFKVGEIHTWTESKISQFEDHWPFGSKQRLALRFTSLPARGAQMFIA